MKRIKTGSVHKEPSAISGYTDLKYTAAYDICFSVFDRDLITNSSVDIVEYYRRKAEQQINDYIFEDLAHVLSRTILYIQSLSCASAGEEHTRIGIVNNLNKLLEDLRGEHYGSR